MREWGKSKMGGDFLEKEFWYIKVKNPSNPVSCCDGKCCWLPQPYSFAPLSGKNTLDKHPPTPTSRYTFRLGVWVYKL